MEFDMVKIILSDVDYICRKKKCEDENRKHLLLKKKIMLISILLIMAMIIIGIYYFIKMLYSGVLLAIFGIAVIIGIMLAIYNNCGEYITLEDNILLSHLLKDKGYEIINLDINEESSDIFIKLKNNEKEVEDFILEIPFYKIRKKTNILKPIINLKDNELIVPYVNHIYGN